MCASRGIAVKRGGQSAEMSWTGHARPEQGPHVLLATMKTLALSCALALAFGLEPADAAGLNLSWNECGSAGLLTRRFACNANSGSFSLVGSYSPA